jgi:hypothetical protein
MFKLLAPKGKILFKQLGNQNENNVYEAHND